MCRKWRAENTNILVTSTIFTSGQRKAVAPIPGRKNAVVTRKKTVLAQNHVPFLSPAPPNLLSQRVFPGLFL